MIYLIKTSYYDEKTCKPMFLLKIGYAKNIDDRIKTYKTHNPLVQLLDTREGDYELENYLHVYFSEYAYPNQSEWFYYNERIIQEFKTVEIKPLLSDILVCIKKLFTTSVSFMRLKERYIEEYGESEFNKSKEFIFNAWLEYSKWMNSIELEIDGNTNNLEYNTIIQVNNIPFDIKTVKFSINQILGRQRLEENPWKNSAELYVTLKYNENSKEDFKAYMNKKMKRTNDLLLAYNSVADDSKDSIAEEYENLAKAYNYSSNYVAVNRHAGSNKVPVLNNLMMVAELRTFVIQEYDYRDRFTVFNALDQYNCSANKDRLERAVSEFENKYTTFVDKMKYICEQEAILSEAEFHVLINLIPMEYRNYIVVLGPERIKANSYAKSRLEEEYRSIVNQQENYSDLEKEIFCQFKPGDKDTKVNIKNKIGQIYQKVGYTKTPKATDLEQYFEIRTCRISNKLTGKKDAGFEIIKKKGD